MFKLYNYQQEYFNYVTSKNKSNFMYEMDTGTGKTIMALFHYKQFYSNKKLIIVAPASKLKEEGWQRTINEFDNTINYDTCSYNMLSKRYKEFVNMFIVFDECHRLKNSTGVWR